MKKLIDIPDEIRWKLQKLATENKLSLKKFIEQSLIKLAKKSS